MSEITAKSKKTGAEVTFHYSLPTSTAGAVSLWGEDKVLHMLNSEVARQLRVVALATSAEGGDVQAAVDAYKVGERKPRAPTDVVASLSKKLPDLTPEALADLLAKVKAAQKASGKAA